MLPINLCPVCGIANDEIELAVHLMNTYEWNYAKAMDWIVSRVERKENVCEN